MADRLKEIPAKLLAWWNKFNPKQKTIIISVTAGVVLTFAILVSILTKPQYEVLITCETTKEASEIKTLLDEAQITTSVSKDGLIISVLKGDISDATLLLGANNYPADGFGIQNALEGGFSSTESDKEKKYKLYLESYMAKLLTQQENIKAAYVLFYIPDDNGTILASKEESYASITLELADAEASIDAKGISKMVATALGSNATDNISIMDTQGKLLFSGGNENDATNIVSNQLNLKQQVELGAAEKVRQTILGTSLYETVKVSPNYVLDYSESETTQHDFSAPDGRNEGMMVEENLYEASGTGGTAAPPGTDTNTEEVPTYVTEDGTNSTYSVTDEKRNYVPNEIITSTKIPPGLIKSEESSMSVVVNHNVVYDETVLQSQGQLDGISFDEFISTNNAITKAEVDPELITAVSRASGIPEDNISIIAYDVPFFQEKEGMAVSPADILQIALIVLILALLGFVVFNSMRSPKQIPEEEELSVETLLQTTQDITNLDDLELEGKSDARRMIEKFVEENPDAVANLLRNWLSEDWG